jgi:hypothetical protein
MKVQIPARDKNHVLFPDRIAVERRFRHAAE